MNSFANVSFEIKTRRHTFVKITHSDESSYVLMSGEGPFEIYFHCFEVAAKIGSLANWQCATHFFGTILKKKRKENFAFKTSILKL